MGNCERSDSDVAIVGMAGVFPGARDVRTYWENILSMTDCVTEAPAGWEGLDYYDPEAASCDRIYCRRGGFLAGVSIDPSQLAVPSNAIDGAEPDHFIALQAAIEALADAGYSPPVADPGRVEIIVGRGNYYNRGNTNLLQHFLLDQVIGVLKKLHPERPEPELCEIKGRLKAGLAPFNADVAPGLVPNAMTGRIANHLGIMGANFTVDGACASSLIAVDLAVRDLVSGRCDLALAGGVFATAAAPTFMLFCQLRALSRRGQIRPFDRAADGALLGEGCGMLVLKRRTVAERDGDRIYAVIRGVGLASNGSAEGVLAPSVEGEELAIRRAYTAAGVSPDTVGLVEAHGTGIPIGDASEIGALKRVFGPRPRMRRCALGAVKSMIGHLIPAAGVAGLIKAALALYHKVLPPTLHCDEANPGLGLDDAPFYIIREPRPWIHSGPVPRRSCVNAFGFGGMNAHAVLEEHSSGR